MGKLTSHHDRCFPDVSHSVTRRFGREKKENMKDTESIREDNEAQYEGFKKITTERRKGL